HVRRAGTTGVVTASARAGSRGARGAGADLRVHAARVHGAGRRASAAPDTDARGATPAAALRRRDAGRDGRGRGAGRRSRQEGEAAERKEGARREGREAIEGEGREGTETGEARKGKGATEASLPAGPERCAPPRSGRHGLPGAEAADHAGAARLPDQREGVDRGPLVRREGH